jgi:hypothetical protein
MLKVKYPANLSSIQKEYIDIFGDKFKQKTFIRFSSTRKFLSAGLSIKAILTSDFDKLVSKLPALQHLSKDASFCAKAGSFFNYDDLQPVISRFFMRHAASLKLSTCFYCNIDYINMFTELGDYYDEIDLVNRAGKEDLKRIKNMTEKATNTIIAARKISPITSIKSLVIPQTIKNSLSKMQAREMRNHFTLDHLMGKAEFPLFALSLHNLVPCCYSCNSKFKGKVNLFDKAGINFLSPNSKNHSFGDDVKFKVHYKLGGYSHTNSQRDFAVYFDIAKNKDEYSRYIDLLKLRFRYIFHKDEVMKLIDKAKKYTDSQIKEISRITCIPESKVREDLFGQELFRGDAHAKPLTKMRRDIARGIGISGVIA